MPLRETAWHITQKNKTSSDPIRVMSFRYKRASAGGFGQFLPASRQRTLSYPVPSVRQIKDSATISCFSALRFHHLYLHIGIKFQHSSLFQSQASTQIVAKFVQLRVTPVFQFDQVPSPPPTRCEVSAKLPSSHKVSKYSW